MNFAIFLRYFAKYLFFVRNVVITLLLHIVLGGVVVSYLEGLHIGESIYFAFITGLTVGYGDIEPVTTLGTCGQRRHRDHRHAVHRYDRCGCYASAS